MKRFLGLIFLLMLVNTVYAGWNVTVNATNQLEPVTFGVKEKATDGFDAELDNYANFPQTDKVILNLDEIYLVQIKKENYPKTWDFSVGVPEDSNEEIRWNMYGVPEDISLIMYNDDTQVDLKSQTSLSLDSGSYQFTIKADKAGSTVKPANNPASGGGSGGGGGGAASIKTEEFKEGKIAVEGNAGKSVRFMIEGNSHTVQIEKVNKDTVTVIIKSKIIKDTLKIGETKQYDVDEDNKKDISVKLKSIVNGKANLIVSELSYKPTVSQNKDTTNAVEDNKADEEQTQNVDTEDNKGIKSITGAVIGSRDTGIIIGSMVMISFVLAGLAVYFFGKWK